MVKANQRLWKNEEIFGMAATVSALRRMRSAAVMQKSTTFLRIRKSLNNFFGGKEEIHPSQEALSDAEELANAAGDYFAAKLTKNQHGKTEYEKWQNLLSDARKQYLLYGTTTYAQTSLTEVIGNSIIGRLRHVHIDPNHTVDWDLLKNNNLGVDSLGKLIYQNIGIISPLSGDFLMASFYRSYLQRTRGRTFPVRATALSKDLSEVVLPVDENGNIPFEEKQTIAIYLDTSATGNTGRALFGTLQELYPQKKIIPPNFEKAEFPTSRKIEKYWGRV